LSSARMPKKQTTDVASVTATATFTFKGTLMIFTCDDR
jgi:hypothetical protein